MPSDINQSPAVESRHSSHRWVIVVAILSGILIPVSLAIVPIIYDRWVPHNEIVYSIEGPISMSGFAAVYVVVENTGREAQSNLEVWIPKRTIVRTDNAPEVLVSTAPEPDRVESRSDFEIFRYKTLRPGEVVQITMALVGMGGYIDEWSLRKARIVSDAVVAKMDEPNEFLEFIYRLGSFLFVLLLIGLISYGVYWDFIKSKESKIKELRELLKKLEDVDS